MLKDIIELCKIRFGSYEKMAEKLDLDPTVISHWKTGKRKPNHIHIMQMADFIGYDRYHVLCLVMEEIDTKNAELWRSWRPYGDSNPGYRRERATLQSSIFYHIFCKVMLTWVGVLARGVNFQVLNENIFALCEYQNDPTKLRHGKGVHLASQES